MAKKKIEKIDPSALRHYRTKANLTQRQLAEKISVSQSAISFYEDGQDQPSDEIIDRMCEALEIGRIDLQFNAYNRLRIAREVYIRRNAENIIENKPGIEGKDLDIQKPEQVMAFFDKILGEPTEIEIEELTDEEQRLIETTTESGTDIPDFPESPMVPEE